jgi:hypothetical protein
LFDSLHVDEHELGLLSLLFELPNPGFQPRPGLVQALEILPGIRQIVETREDGDVIALGVVRTIAEADDLKARIQEHVPGEGVRMRLIGRESHAAAPATWLDLAQREVADLSDDTA